MSPIVLLPNALSELFAQSHKFHKLTIADRYGLMAAILDDSLTVEERQTINRLFYAVNRGHVQVVNELSIIETCDWD